MMFYEKGRQIRKENSVFKNKREYVRWHVAHHLREVKNSIAASLVAWLFGKIYELDPNKWYAFSIKSPRRGELRHLAETLPMGSSFCRGGLIWGPGLEIELLEDFIDKVLQEHNPDEIEMLTQIYERIKGGEDLERPCQS